MDLGLYLSVLGRHRRIVVSGVCAAVFLAFFAAARVGSDGVHLRSTPVYATEAILLVSQEGSPLGGPNAKESRSADAAIPRPFDPTRFQYLAALYASLAEGDNIRVAAGLPIDRDKPHLADYVAVPLRSNDGNTPLPLVAITTTSASKQAAVNTARRVVAAFRASVEKAQRRAGVNKADRVRLTVVQQPESPTIVTPRRLTRPIMVFILIIMLTVGAAFVAENLGRASRPSRVLRDTDEGEAVPQPLAPRPSVAEVPAPARSNGDDREQVERLGRVRAQEAKRQTLGS